MLLPLLDPAHGAADQAGEEGDQQVLGVDVSLGAETAADIERDAADARLGQPQEPGGRPAHVVHHLRRRPDGDGIGCAGRGRRSRRGTPREGRRSDACRSDGEAFEARRQARPPPRPSRWRSSPIGLVANSSWRTADPAPARPRHRRRPASGSISTATELGGIERLVAAFGHDHRDRLADMADLAHGQHRLLRIVDGVLHLGSPLGRQRQLPAGNRRREALQLIAGEHAHDARQSPPP